MGSRDMNQSVIGTWLLERFDIEETAKQVRPWGKNTTGLLIYTADGHMSVHLNRDMDANTKDEAQRIFDAILSYAGTYKVEGNLIRHQVTQASNPARIGKEMIRYAAFKDGVLELSTPVESFGRAFLVWRKVTG